MTETLVTKLSKRECFTLSELDTVKTVSEKLQKHNVGAMPVLSKQNNEIIGIVSERDLARFTLSQISMFGECTKWFPIKNHREHKCFD